MTEIKCRIKMICQAKCGGMPLVPALRRQRQIGFFEFQPRMFYTVSSTQDRQSFISETVPRKQNKTIC